MAGNVLPESVNSIHCGITGETGVVLIVFYAGVKGIKVLDRFPPYPRYVRLIYNSVLMPGLRSSVYSR